MGRWERRMAKPEQRKLTRLLKRALKARQATPSDMGWDILVTPIGRLAVSWYEGHNIFCLFMRFLDMDLVKAAAARSEGAEKLLLEMNPYTGKWNVYFHQGETAVEAMGIIESKLDRVMKVVVPSLKTETVS